MPDFWQRLADKFWAQRPPNWQAIARLTREEAQSRGDRKDNQGGGGEAAITPGASGPRVFPVVTRHSAATFGADAPLAHPLDIPESPGLGPRIRAEPETYIGWRWWILEGRPLYRLHSLSHSTIWDGPTLVADRKPTPSNYHGIYSMRAKWDGMGYRQSTGAYGSIEYSGTVVMGEDGFRGEVATIRSLYLERHIFREPEISPFEPNPITIWPGDDIVKALEDRYQVSVELMDPPEPPERHFIYSASTAPISGYTALSIGPTRTYLSQGSGYLSQLQNASQQNAYLQAVLRSLHT